MAPGDTAHAFVSLSETVDGQPSVLTTGAYRTTIVEQDRDVRFSDIVVSLDR